MVIDGKALAEGIIEQIKLSLQTVREKKINPKIAIVTVGPEGAWKTYVAQKLKFADKMGIRKELTHLESPTTDELVTIIKKLNNDKTTHGIIVQRPLPAEIDRTAIVNAISQFKDIDGFRDDSKFQSPIWLAIIEILRFIHKQERSDTQFDSWMRKKTFVVVGKGETGGRPTIIELKKMGIEPIVIDSKTQNPETIFKQGDVIISGVGKRTVEAKNLKKGAILIGIGIHRGKDEKLYGDYNEEEIKDVVSYYTPTPGGVGPLNLSFLFANLLQAAD